MVAISRILNLAGRMLLDTKFQNGVTKSLRVTGRTAQKAGNSKFSKFGKQVKDAFVYADKHTGGANNTFFQDMKKLITSTPSEFKNAWKGAKGFTAKSKALFKVAGKRVPILGNALMLAFSIPTIWQATKDEGLLGGALEAGKEVSKLTAGAAGMAIGSAICPGVGSIIGGLIGWTAGEWLMSKVVGKSYLEKKQAAAEQKQELLQATGTNQITTPQFDMTTGMSQNTPYTSAAGMSVPFGGQPTLSNEQLMQCYNALYGRNKIGLGDNNLNLYG